MHASPKTSALAATEQNCEIRKFITLSSVIIFIAAFAMMISAPFASAQTAAEAASIRQVATLLSSAHKASGNQSGLRSAVSRHFAVGTWSNALLGKFSRKFSSGQKSEFRRLFPSYIAKQYFKQFGGSGSKPGEVTKARTVRGDVLVTSRIPGRGRTFTVVWRMRVIGGKPRVIDYSTGGISTVVLKRSEFGSKIKKSGPDGLNSFIKAFIAS